jgi:hypothetical protein
MKRTSTPGGLRADLSRFASVPRDVRLTAGGKTVMGLAVVFAAGALAAAIGLSVLRAGQQSDRAALTADAVAASATVVRVTTTRGEDPKQVATYRYSVGAAEYENSVRLREKERREFPVGSRIAVFRSASQPARSWLPGREPEVLPVVVIPLVSVSLLAVGWMIAWVVRRERDLLTEGRFATARVLDTTKVQRSHHHGYRVRYEFTTLSGAKVTGAVERGRPAGSAGETISIVYHRDNPARNAIYPLSLVTPERR